MTQTLRFFAAFAFLSAVTVGGAVPPQGSLTFHADDPAYAFTFSPEQAQDHYIGSFIGWAKEDIGNLPRPDAVLAVGSSSMRLWKSINEDLAPLEILHRGFGGSRMKNVVEFLDFFDRYEAKTILVYEGDNDLSGPWTKVDRDFIDPTLTFIAHVQEQRPETEIYFISIKPSPSRVAAAERFTTANARLKEICASDPKLHFIDVYHPMLGPDGQPDPSLFRGDKLHLNEKGYALWAKIVREAMGLPPLGSGGEGGS